MLISAVLTAFVLVVLGGLAAIVLQPSAPATTATSAAPAAAPPVQALDPNREAAYQQALADAQAQLVEAIRRLEQANAELAATAVPPPPPPPVPTEPPAAPAYAVSADVAGQIALLVAPGATLQAAPDLVLYEGTAAYEVALDQGRVYVDAATGRVLYNGARAPQAQAPATLAGRAYEPQENEEHEGGGDD
jgi:uncharacterized membrane protein YkoI